MKCAKKQVDHASKSMTSLTIYSTTSFGWDSTIIVVDRSEPVYEELNSQAARKLTKRELTKWELTKWEVDKVGTDKVHFRKI